MLVTTLVTPRGFPRPKPFWIRLLRARHGLQNAWHVSFSTDRQSVLLSFASVL
jgi:hypothetical protein